MLSRRFASNVCIRKIMWWRSSGRLYRDHPWPDGLSSWRSFYNQRGIAERWIREGNSAARLSCRRLATNALRLQSGDQAHAHTEFIRRYWGKPALSLV